MEFKFRQAIFHPVTGSFLRWHYWGLIDGAFIGVDTGWVSPTTAIKNSQYLTGLRDKNGVEIYEGDIIIDPKVAIKLPCEIFWAETSWHYRTPKSHLIHRFDYWLGSTVEVIGNIYSDKDLL